MPILPPVNPSPSPIAAQAVSSILTNAYRLAGILVRAGSGESPSQTAEALGALNTEIDSWKLQEHCAFAELRTEFALDASGAKPFYTVGLTALDQAGTRPDIEIPRPTYLRGAGICFNNVTPEIETPMRVLTDEEYQRMSPKLLASTIPYLAHYKAEVPNGHLYLWPLAKTAWRAAIYTLEGISQFTATTQALVIPDGYRDAMEKRLALRLVAMNPTTAKPSPRLEQWAKGALDWVKQRNFQPREMTSEGGARGLIQQTGRYNILTNTYSR